jgi:hypothetical protein
MSITRESKYTLALNFKEYEEIIFEMKSGYKEGKKSMGI